MMIETHRRLHPRLSRFSSLPALTAWIATLPFTVLAAPIWAAEGDKSEEPTITVRDEVVVEDAAPYSASEATTATKVPVPLRLTPASLSTISRTVLNEQNALVLGEALENVPGVTAHRQGNTADLFYIRGFESQSSALVMTDGAVEPEAAFYPTYNVERVEVVRGPTSFLYGGSPLAGAVNLVRKRPAADDFLEIEGLYGSDQTAYGTLDYNHGGSDGLGLRINALWQDSAGYRDGRDLSIAAINPSFGWRIGEDTSLLFNLEYEQHDIAPDGGIPVILQSNRIADVPRSRTYQPPFDETERDVYRAQLSLESSLGPRLTLRNKLYVNGLDTTSRSALLNGAVPNAVFIPGAPGVSVLRTLALLEDDQRFAGNQLELLFTSAGSGRVRHQLLAGLEVQHLSDDFTFDFGQLPAIDLDNPVETATEPVVLIPGVGFAGDTTTVVLAPYVLDTISLGERWRFFLGGRFDAIDTEDDLTGFSDSDSQFSPFVGALFAPTTNLSLYANYGQSFSPPSALVVAEDRVPEEGEQVEVGIKNDFFGGRLTTALAFYHLEKEKIAIADGLGLPAQIGDQESDGIELELSGHPADGFNWLFSYAYTDAELTRFTEAVTVSLVPFSQVILDHSGNQPAWVPEHTARLWLSQRFPFGLTLAGGARYVGERFLDEDNQLELDDYITLDASISYRWQRLTATLHLKNLSDEEYDLRAPTDQAVLPADGFHVLGGLRIRL